MTRMGQLKGISKLTTHRTKTSSLFREVCERLRQYVTNIGPGSRLSEIELSGQLGISRTPVREALLQLSNEGLVQYRGNGRCYVATITKKDAIDMSDIRTALESAAARSLAQSITTEQLAELSQLAAAADEAELRCTSRTEWDHAEDAFHRRFLEFADNPRIFEILARQGLIERLLTFPLSNWQHLARRDPGPDHQALIAALTSRDPERCERVFRAHTDGRKRWLISEFEALERREAQGGNKE